MTRIREEEDRICRWIKGEGEWKEGEGGEDKGGWEGGLAPLNINLGYKPVFYSLRWWQFISAGVLLRNCSLTAVPNSACWWLSVGVLALAKYTDDKWYRAQVTRVLGHQLEVELIDFGSLICVSASDG